MWFGTKYGCSRFDGIEFKSYNYNKNELKLTGSGWVNQIVSDNKNRLWFAIAGTGSAIMRYDYETDSFINISPLIIKQLNLKNKLFGIWQIYLDSDGYIWTEYPNYGFICYKPENNSIEVFSHKNVTQKNSPSYKFSENDLWIATSDMGLYRLNKLENQLSKFDSRHSIPGNTILGILEDRFQNLWISTNKGFARLKLINDSIPDVTIYRQEEGLSIGDFVVRSCAKLSDGSMMFGKPPREFIKDTLKE